MPAPRPIRLLLCGALAAVLPLSGCTAEHKPRPVAAPGLRLVAFDSCAQLLTDLRRAAAQAVGPYGFPGDGRAVRADGIPPGGAVTAVDPGEQAAAPAFSGTNDHEADADEPDIVKTDGRRIVTVQGGVLRVVDAATRTRTGQLDLDVRDADAELFLAGDRALVLTHGSAGYVLDRTAPSGAEPEVLLIDLTGAPRLVSRYRGDGVLVDARQTGTVARVVLKNSPRITFREGAAQDAPRDTVTKAPLGAWLPSWSLTTGGQTRQGTVPCDRVSRPPDYSGTSLVTMLTFDLAAPVLDDGDPISVVADADTVYGTGGSLYLAADQRWRLDLQPGRRALAVPQRTELHRFALRGRDRPAYAASGSVPGFLINQYALSEWDGHLRVATTSEEAASPGAGIAPDAGTTASAIRVLRQHGDKLEQTGIVEGLGRGQRIYAVRFLGPRGYVVTFRQTDPLYSVDLSDPAKPVATGELSISGYSAHLQPVGEGRLVGIGQEAGSDGRTQGTQVSLFDVADAAAPRQLAREHVDGGQSEAEWDPHALLWWPATRLLVVPVTDFGRWGDPRPKDSALALRVTGDGLARVGAVAQPAVDGAPPTVRRSLVVGDVLWTLSDAGLQASGLATLDRLSWLPNA
jgi:uncharacterized secreted protein with C-terminal beta-propeller domain